MRLPKWIKPSPVERVGFPTKCRFCGKDDGKVALMFPGTKVSNGRGSICICNECVEYYYQCLIETGVVTSR
jgi:hypothetical protein